MGSEMCIRDSLRGGNMFMMEGVRIVEEMPDNLLWVRYWDLASTEKERISPDPDYTAGALVAYNETVDGMPQLYIKDMQECQAEAGRRNALIRRTAESDGAEVWQGVESVAGFKDSYTTLREILKGKSTVHKGTVSGDKIVRASNIEPIFEACNVFILNGRFKDNLLKELREFPASVHDDRVDAVTGGYLMARERYEKLEQLGARLGKGAV